ADFYGSMDGASKFVRGDAIAGLIITVVNILGGLTIGVFQRGFTFQEALQTYGLLTVGDGLVAQIPALLLSTATGIIVTRAAGESNLGRDIVTSLSSNCRPLFIGAGLLFALAVVPGLPTVPFLLLGTILALAAFVVYREGKAPPGEPASEVPPPAAKAPAGAPESVLPLVAVDPMEVEIGYALIPLVDPSQGGDMLDRIATIRRQMAMERGLVVPPIRIRDNIQLKPTEYLIRIKGAQVARAEIMPDHYLAMNTSGTEEPLVGIPTKEPAFGLEGYWIAPELREQAESLGYTVVDAPSVLATHISEIVKKYGAELLTRQETQKLVDLVKESNPAVTEELMNALSLGDVQKVLQNLLRESVPIRDLVTIFETLADVGRISRNPDFLTERVREALFRHITISLQDPQGTVAVLTLSPRWEQRVKESMQGDLASGWRLNMPVDDIQKLIKTVGEKMEKAAAAGHAPALLVH
ncbi:MAG: FHIPEP family type III secretion protein, partial [Synergistales bacterium]|nr:FHIPEP family type III secretion protein [Synergistales bacterium]